MVPHRLLRALLPERERERESLCVRAFVSGKEILDPKRNYIHAWLDIWRIHDIA